MMCCSLKYYKVIYRNLPINILLTAFFFLDYYAIMSQNTDNTKENNMKASHRKDVIIARLIFAAICLFLIALIATIVITVNSKGGKKGAGQGTTECS